MKLAELKTGEVYAIGSASSRYLKDVGLVLDTQNYVGPGRWDRGDKFTPSKTRPQTYERRSFGVPVATISAYANVAQANKLAKIDPAKVKLVSGEQLVNGVKVYVLLVPTNLFRNTYAQWAEDQKTAEDSRAAYQKTLDDRTAENERVGAEIRKLIPRAVRFHTTTTAKHSGDEGSIVINDPAAFLAFLQGRS